MNTLPEPKSIELSDGGRAILLPNLDLGIYTKGNPKGIFLEAEDFQAIIRGISVDIVGEAVKPLQFPELPENEEWNNPDNLTPEQFGEGYRPLLKSEVVAFNLQRSREINVFSVWEGGKWKDGKYMGTLTDRAYRTSDPLPTPKAKEEGFKKGDMAFHNNLVGKAAVASFLRKCRVIVLANPMDEPDPFGTPGSLVVLNFGRKEGFGEINPDGDFESYLDGKTFKVRNIISITP